MNYYIEVKPMEEKIDLMRSKCKGLNFNKNMLSDEYLFTIVCVDNYYYKGNIGNKDIEDGFTDGSGDGGIDFIYTDNEKMFLIQGKSSSTISKEEIHNIFNKMERTVRDFSDNKFDNYNNDLKRTYLNARDSLEDETNIELVLFTNALINQDVEKKFYNDIENTQLENFSISIYDNDKIRDKIYSIDREPDFVSRDTIKLEKAQNFLRYGDDGLITNILASDLKRLYQKHNGKGLFALNLREHISQKNVDSGIEETIKNDRNNFWFYNNGVTIACEDYHISGNIIEMYGFSIINGAQTTTKIGKSSFVNSGKDFSLVCKIVRVPEKVSDSVTFMNNISEYSNSQKPIKARDLKANKPEQRRFQHEASKNGNRSLAIEIKRGVRPSNFSSVEKWQRKNNEELGQLMLACLLQQPGTARSGKAKIFGSEKIYNDLYKRKHDYNTLHNIVKLEKIYDEYRTNLPAAKDNDSSGRLIIAKNGKLVVLAIICFMVKHKRGLVSDEVDESIYKDNLSGTLIENYRLDDFEQKLHWLFERIIRTLQAIYDSKKIELGLTSHSNLFKTDSNYKKHIIPGIYDKLYVDTYAYESNLKNLLDVLDD